MDPSPRSADATVRSIARPGLAVQLAGSGNEAVRQLLEAGADLVVTQWHAGGMSAVDLCRAIRGGEGMPAPHIIVLAAGAGEAEVAEALNAGADDVVAGSPDARELQGRIRGGERFVQLRRDLDRRAREIHRINAEMAVANARLLDAHDRLEVLAKQDELTRLPNRREALRRLAGHWSRCEAGGDSVACIMVDLDHFKNINDRYGHEAGDQVLRHTAETLQSLTRRNEDVCRLGGEEFLVLLPHATEASASVAAGRLRAGLEAQSIPFQEQVLRVTGSLGVAARTPEMKSADELIRAADRALYRAKNTGRNKVCLSSACPGSVTDAALLHRRIEAAGKGNWSRRPNVLMLTGGPDHEAARAALSGGGGQVMDAGDSAELFQAASDRLVDVVVLPSTHPEYDVRELARRVQQDPSTQDAWLVVVGSSRDAAELELAAECQADDFLAPPLDAAEVAFRLETLSRHGEAFAELEQAHGERLDHGRAMRLLLQFAMQIQAAPGPAAVCRQAVSLAGLLMQCRRAVLLLRAEKRHSLEVAATLGVTGGAELFPAEETLFGRVIAAGEPCVANCEADVPSAMTTRERDLLGRPPFACIPLLEDDWCRGTLVLADRAGGEPFEGADLEYADLLCMVTAAAVREQSMRQDASFLSLP